VLKRNGQQSHSSVDVGYDTFSNLLEGEGLHGAGRAQHLNLDMAVSEKLDFVVCAWASDGNHNGITHAFEIEQDSGILELRNKLKQLL
jgi:hypothetical protein